MGCATCTELEGSCCGPGEPERRVETCAWCLLAERAGRPLCDFCGRPTDAFTSVTARGEEVT